MSIVNGKIFAASPVTERGRPTQLSADPKGERIAYAVSRPISDGNPGSYCGSEPRQSYMLLTAKSLANPSS